MKWITRRRPYDADVSGSRREARYRTLVAKGGALYSVASVPMNNAAAAVVVQGGMGRTQTTPSSSYRSVILYFVMFAFAPRIPHNVNNAIVYPLVLHNFTLNRIYLLCCYALYYNDRIVQYMACCTWDEI